MDFGKMVAAVIAVVLTICLTVIVCVCSTTHMKCRSAERMKAMETNTLYIEGYGPHQIPSNR